MTGTKPFQQESKQGNINYVYPSFLFYSHNSSTIHIPIFSKYNIAIVILSK